MGTVKIMFYESESLTKVVVPRQCFSQIAHFGCQQLAAGLPGSVFIAVLVKTMSAIIKYVQRSKPKRHGAVEDSDLYICVSTCKCLHVSCVPKVNSHWGQLVSAVVPCHRGSLLLPSLASSYRAWLMLRAQSVQNYFSASPETPGLLFLEL